MDLHHPRQGQRALCEHCDQEIYFSKARPIDDPWVHSDWPKRCEPGEEPSHMRPLPAHDHDASPVTRQYAITLVVRTTLLDADVKTWAREQAEIGPLRTGRINVEFQAQGHQLVGGAS